MLVAAILLAALAFAAGRSWWARRHGAGWRRAIAAGVLVLVGLVSAGLGLAHLIAVIAVGVDRPGPLAYDFRLASLILVGVLLVVGGALAASARPGAALAGVAILLLVNVPLIPVQGFAVALTVAAVVSLAAVRFLRT